MTLMLLLEAHFTTTLRSCLDGRLDRVDLDDVIDTGGDVNDTGSHVSSTGLLQALQHVPT